MVEPTKGAKGGKKARRAIRKALSTAGETYYNISIYIFTIAWMATILLGFAGYYQYYQLNGLAMSFAALTYDTLKLFVLGGGDLDWSNGYVPVLDFARWMALIVYFWAAALIVSRAFLGPLHRLRLWLCTDHIVVCGMGSIGSSFARALSEDHQVVIIDKEPHSKVEDELKGTGVVYVHGNATEEKVLRHAGIARARYLITALGEDSANAEIAIQARRIVTGRSFDPLTCFVHVLDPELCEVLRVNEFNAGSRSMRLEFYNVFENGARTILNDFPAFPEHNVETVPLAKVLVIGLDDVGKRLLLGAAKRWWPHFQATGRKLQLALVDADADKVLDSHQRRYPSLRDSCSFRTISMDVRRLRMATEEELMSLTADGPTIIYICTPSDSDGLSLALTLRKRLGNEGASIVVRMNADTRPAMLLGKEGREAGLANIHTFGFWGRTCTKALIQNGTREIMGQAIHEEYCREQKASGTLTEAAKTSWDDLSEEFRESNRAQADHIFTKSKAIGRWVDAMVGWGPDPDPLTPYEVHRLSRMEHDRWYQEKVGKGWRYGKERDDAQRRHDDLVPWEGLTPLAKFKDIATVNKIPRILARVDLRLNKADMPLQVAKALLMDELSKGEKGGEGNIDPSTLWRAKLEGEIDPSTLWREMPEGDKSHYLDEAKVIMECLRGMGCDITGKASCKEELGAFSPSDLAVASRKYEELMVGRGGKGLLTDHSRWPAVLAKGGLAIYRLEEARTLVAKDREAMSMAFSGSELDDPFMARRGGPSP